MYSQDVGAPRLLEFEVVVEFDFNESYVSMRSKCLVSKSGSGGKACSIQVPIIQIYLIATNHTVRNHLESADIVYSPLVSDLAVLSFERLSSWVGWVCGDICA